MKKVILFCFTAWLLSACTSSSPSIIETTASDNDPVTEQRVLLQVVSLSDNPPMTYLWSSSGTSGSLEVGTDTQNYAYWTTPSEAGHYQVTCTIKDDEDNTETQVFEFDVREREVEPIQSGNEAISMRKQADTVIGGVWVSFESGDIQYITSSADQATTWSGAFDTMYVSFDSYYLSHTLWAAAKPGNIISAQSSSGSSEFTCTKCSSGDSINDIFVSLSDPYYFILVGSDSGMHWYSSEANSWGTYKTIKTSAFFQKDTTSLAYAATTSGIYQLSYLSDAYTLKPSTDPIYPGNSCAVLEDSSGNVWHITDGHLYKEGQLIANQPVAELPCSLDIDNQGRIWCGKYRWDDSGQVWWSPDQLAGYTVVKAIASTEGLMYFLTDSGALLRY